VEEIEKKFLRVLRDLTAFEPLREQNLQKTRMTFALRKTFVCTYMDLPKHKMEDAMLIGMVIMKMNEDDDKVLPLVNHMCEIQYRIVESFRHRYCKPLGEVPGFICS